MRRYTGKAWTMISPRSLMALAAIPLLLTGWACCGLPRAGAPALAPSVLVVTDWPGATVEEVESSLAVPLEASVNGLAGLASVRSTCVEGRHSMEVQFEATASEPLASVLGVIQGTQGALPDSAGTPRVGGGGAEHRRAARIVVTGDAMLEHLGSSASVLEKELYRVTGVERVEVVGRLHNRVLIQVDADRATAYQLDVDAVEGALTHANVSLPGDSQLMVAGGGDTPWDELERAVIRVIDGEPVTLGDVARIELSYADRDRVVTFDGQPAVLLEVFHADGMDVSTVAAAVAQEVDRQSSLLPPHMRARVLDEGDPELTTMVTRPGGELSDWPALLAAIEEAGQTLGCKQSLAVMGARRFEGGPPFIDPNTATVSLWWEDAIPEGARVQIEEGAIAPVPMIAGQVVHPDAARMRFEIMGEDLESLERTAADVAAALSGSNAVRSLKPRPAPSKPDIMVRPDREALARFGLTTAAVSRAMVVALHGIEIGDVAVGDERVPLVLRWGTHATGTVEDLRRVTVASPDGSALIPLTAIADLEMVEMPAMIHRVNGYRTVCVGVELVDGKSATRRAAIESLSELQLPAGVSFQAVDVE